MSNIPVSPTVCGNNQGRPHDWKTAPVVDLSLSYWCTLCSVDMRISLVKTIFGGREPSYLDPSIDGAPVDYEKGVARAFAFNDHRTRCEVCKPFALGGRLCDLGYRLIGKMPCLTCLCKADAGCKDCLGLSMKVVPTPSPEGQGAATTSESGSV